jgi:hypothetical protein
MNPTALDRVGTAIGTTLVLILLAFAQVRHRRRRVLRKHGGSRPGRRRNRDIGTLAGAAQLDRDYFLDPAERNQDGGFGPTFSKAEFTGRFRMPPELYNVIKLGILEVDNYFEQRRDAVGSFGESTNQKITAALRQLALGLGADSVVEATRLSESTAAECRPRFCRAVVARFGAEHMRVPTVDDLRRIEARYAKLGFPG